MLVARSFCVAAFNILGGSRLAPWCIYRGAPNMKGIFSGSPYFGNVYKKNLLLVVQIPPPNIEYSYDI